MSDESEAIRSDLDALASSMERYAAAVGMYTEAASGEIERLWADNAELRDEVHAVANRLENLTTFVTTSPAEVAAAIVNDANRETLREVFTCRLNPGCNVSRPHVHNADGAVIYVEDAAMADRYLGQRDVVRAITRNDQEPS